jgi:hypothetical protein
MNDNESNEFYILVVVAQKQQGRSVCRLGVM